MNNYFKFSSLTLFLLFCLSFYSCSTSETQFSPREMSSWNSCYESLDQVLSLHRYPNPNFIQNLEQVNQLRDLDHFYGNESMFSWQARLSNQEIKEMNQKVIDLLSKEEIPSGVRTFDQPTIDEISRDQAETLFQDMKNSPCVRNLNRYQRDDVTIGYCFGKATLVHMTSLIRGVNPHSIKKIWIVGETTGWWGHHVAGMVKGENGKWWVMDKDAGELVDHETWIHLFSRLKKNKDLMIFVTDPERFGPANNVQYNTFDLFNVPAHGLEQYSSENDYYKGFFKDVFDWIDGNEELERFVK
ncbi:MAG: hypothetical protein CME60_06645 [Halobacteriovoraceae bacterium]|nr:hypothetical protein [Halobacteriovoraceae bacterium]